METVCLPDAFPRAYRCVYMAQFEGVRNGGELRDALIRASKADDDAERRRVDFAFVDARLVQSRQQLMTAIVQAIVGAMRRDPKRPDAEVGLKTPSIHSDLLWTLHSNNNIAEALRRFGVSSTTSTLILVRVAPPLDAGELVQHMTQLVDGTLQTRGLSLPSPALAWSELGTTYKIQDTPAFQHPDTSQVDALICSMVASKYVGA